MFKSPKIVHVCDHVVREIINDTMIEDYTKSDSDIDLICEEGIISRVNSVYSEDVDGNITIYYKHINYNIYEKVNIKWISNAPLAGEIFTVNYTNTLRKTKQYQPEECPKCAGFGWYVSLFNDNNTSVENVTGSEKLIQGFLKVLLTKRINDYGSTLNNIIGNEISNRPIIETNIIEAVADCEVQYKKFQLTNINESNLASSEKLKSATVSSIDFDIEENAIYISVVLQNEQGSRSQLNLMI